MLELKLGFMLTEELAEWAGKKCTSSFKKNKARWCESTLSKYAEYELVRGGVIITKIKFSIFKSSAYQEVKEKFLDNWGYEGHLIDSCTECYYKTKPTMTNKVKDNTGKAYVSKAKCERFGVAYKGKKRNGTDGMCHYVFCKSPGIPFTDEEQKIKQELQEKYLRSEANQIFTLKELCQSLKDGDLSREEFQEEVERVVNHEMRWNQFVEALEKKLNCAVGFYQELEPGAFPLDIKNIPYSGKPYEF